MFSITKVLIDYLDGETQVSKKEPKLFEPKAEG